MDPSGYLAIPKPAPNLNIPLSSATVRVSIIDSTFTGTFPVAHSMEPAIKGFTQMIAPSYSFLIQHSSGRTLLFDLGGRKDWETYASSVVSMLKGLGADVRVEKDVSEILQTHGVDVAGGAIEAIIWSHWHFDHIGDPSTFPGSTALIVGEGFKKAFLPAYPGNEKSPVLETDFAGREVMEIDFTAGPELKIGGFRAFDFFGDGSFYLLDAPGHTIAHLCALARVTTAKQQGEPDTFVFMGADACHHGGQFRPTEYLPLPKEISPSPIKAMHRNMCPGALFQDLHPSKSATKPLLRVNKGFAHDHVAATQTIRFVEEFDAADNVLVVTAHDSVMLDEDIPAEFFPHGSLNNWKETDLAAKARWGFLKDFQHAVS